MNHSATVPKKNELLEAIYRVDLPQTAWQKEVAEEIERRRTIGTGVFSYQFDASHPDGMVRIGTTAGAGEIGPFQALTGPVHDKPVAGEYDLAIRRGTHVGTTRETLRLAGVRDVDSTILLSSIAAAGYRDIWALCSVNPDGTGLAFAVPTVDIAPLPSPRLRHEWSRVAIHIAASQRLRSRLKSGSYEEAAAIFRPDGHPCHLTDEAIPDREALGHFIKSLDRARTQPSEKEELLSLWKGLIEGRWSVFDQADSDGKHFIVVHENNPYAAGPKRLTHRELQVATYAAQGHPNKVIAYELGIAPNTVATHLSSALSKLGVNRRTDLVWLYGRLVEPAASTCGPGNPPKLD